MVNNLPLTLKFVCGICECEYDMKKQAKLAKCYHTFCDSCLQHYIIYKVGVFGEVFCPQEDCNKILDVDSQFFSHLPPEIQKKYKKIHLFYLTTKDISLRLCPNEKCEDGVLKIMSGTNPKCSKCQKSFCENCMFPQHEGKCDNYEVDFF